MITCFIDMNALKITARGPKSERDMLNKIRNWVSADKDFAEINRTTRNQQEIRMALLGVSKCIDTDHDTFFYAEYNKEHGKEAIAHIIQKLENRLDDKFEKVISLKYVSTFEEAQQDSTAQLDSKKQQNGLPKEKSINNSKKEEKKNTKDLTFLTTSNHLSRKRKRTSQLHPSQQPNGISNEKHEHSLANGNRHTNKKRHKL